MPAKRKSRKPRPSPERRSPAKATPPDLDAVAVAPAVPALPVVTPPDLDAVAVAPAVPALPVVTSPDLDAVAPAVPVVATPPAPKTGPPVGGARFAGAARSQRAGQGRQYAFRRS